MLTIVSPAYAQSGGDIAQVQNFLKNVTQILVTLAGSISVIFFVIGGIGYMTSSGHPENLDRSKKTILYSGIGLAISLGAFVLSNIVTQAATSAFGS